MIKNLLKIGLLLVVAVIGYNYFLGDAEEKESSKKIVDGVKEIGKSVGGVIKSETEKFSEGKLDRVLAKMSTVMSSIEAQPTENTELKGKLKELMRERDALQEKVNKIQGEDKTEKADRKGLRKEIQALESKFSKLMRDAGINVEEN